MTITTDQIYEILDQVSDPEIPVLTVRNLGIIRQVNIQADETVEVIITPTYSGCPAMNMIEVNIRAALQENGFDNVNVTTVLRPAWTTDWISKEGRRKLKEYGITPPQGSSMDKSALFQEERDIPCPHCDSTNTKLVSQFGSTPCKAQYRCKDCLEPFDYFKCH